MSTAMALKSVEEVEQYMGYIEQVAPSPVFIDLYRIGCRLALRISDLISLKYDDVLGKTHIRLKQKKTKKYIEVFITDDVRDIVEDRKYRNPTDTYIFESDYTRYKGKPLSIRRAQQIFEEVQKMTSTHFQTHTMRKSPARILYENGNSIATISEMLGHNDIATTQRYLGLTQTDVDDLRKSLQLSI